MKRSFVIAAAAAVVLVGGGTATALSAPSDDAPAAPAAAGKSGANVNKAVDTAASAVPGTVTGVDLEDDGREWDVDVFGKDSKWYDVTVDPAGSRVVNKHLDADNDDRRQHAPQSAPVTIEKAMEAALKVTPGNVTEADLEGSHWEIEIHDKNGRGHDVNVDAKTGRATVVQDQDDDGADDDRGSDDAGTAPGSGSGANSGSGSDSDD